MKDFSNVSNWRLARPRPAKYLKNKLLKATRFSTVWKILTTPDEMCFPLRFTANAQLWMFQFSPNAFFKKEVFLSCTETNVFEKEPKDKLTKNWCTVSKKFYYNSRDKPLSITKLSSYLLEQFLSLPSICQDIFGIILKMADSVRAQFGTLLKAINWRLKLWTAILVTAHSSTAKIGESDSLLIRASLSTR